MEQPSLPPNIIDLQKFRDDRENMHDIPESEVAARVLMQWSHPMFPAKSILEHVSDGSVRGESLQTLLTDLLHRAIQDEITLAEDDHLALVFKDLYEHLEDAIQQQAVAHTEILYIKSQTLGDEAESIQRAMAVLRKIIHANDPPRPRPIR